MAGRPEVFAVEGGNLRPLSHQNDAWLADVQLAPVEDTVLHSKDGTEVHGFLVKPLSQLARGEKDLCRDCE